MVLHSIHIFHELLKLMIVDRIQTMDISPTSTYLRPPFVSDSIHYIVLGRMASQTPTCTSMQSDCFFSKWEKKHITFSTASRGYLGKTAIHHQ